MPSGPPAVITKMSDDSHSRERAFLDQKEVYRQILDAIADMVLVKGAGSRILWANKAFRDYYGMTNELLYERVDAIFNQSDYTEQYVRDDHYVFTSGQVLIDLCRQMRLGCAAREDPRASPAGAPLSDPACCARTLSARCWARSWPVWTSCLIWARFSWPLL